MTDNEIVKAFEKCIEEKLKPSILLMVAILDLINRQQADIEKNENIIRLADKTIETANAEIERLKTNLNIELENYATEYDNKIKAEAYREFAERLCEGRVSNDNIVILAKCLLKELVGEDE